MGREGLWLRTALQDRGRRRLLARGLGRTGRAGPGRPVHPGRRRRPGHGRRRRHGGDGAAGARHRAGAAGPVLHCRRSAGRPCRPGDQGQLAAAHCRRPGAGGAGLPGAQGALPARCLRGQGGQERQRLHLERHQEPGAGGRPGRGVHRAGAAGRQDRAVPGAARRRWRRGDGYGTQDGGRAAEVVFDKAAGDAGRGRRTAGAGTRGRHRHCRDLRRSGRRDGPDAWPSRSTT